MKTYSTPQVPDVGEAHRDAACVEKAQRELDEPPAAAAVLLFVSTALHSS